MSDEVRPLSKRDRATLAEYYRDFNATRAWLATHPKSNYDSARASASEWLTKPNVKAEIEAHLAEVQMSADEALKLLAEQARADIGEIMEATTFGYNFDMRKAKETGFTKLIKKVKQKTVTIMGKGEDSEDTEIHTIEIELYDAQAAIDKVLRVAGKYSDKLDLTSGGKVIRVVLKDEDE